MPADPTPDLAGRTLAMLDHDAYTATLGGHDGEAERYAHAARCVKAWEFLAAQGSDLVLSWGFVDMQFVLRVEDHYNAAENGYHTLGRGDTPLAAVLNAFALATGGDDGK